MICCKLPVGNHLFSVICKRLSLNKIVLLLMNTIQVYKITYTNNICRSFSVPVNQQFLKSQLCKSIYLICYLKRKIWSLERKILNASFYTATAKVNLATFDPRIIALDFLQGGDCPQLYKFKILNFFCSHLFTESSKLQICIYVS